METKEKKQKSVFETLSCIDCSEHIEKIQMNGGRTLSYLSWTWAWTIAKQYYPDMTSKVYEAENGWFYHTDGKTCWVKTGVTIQGVEIIEYLPVMDKRNQSIPVDKVTSFDINTSIQRSITKAIARHGLGFNIYAGEDLPVGVSSPTEARIQEGLDAIDAAMFVDDLKEIADKFSDLRRHNAKFDEYFNSKYKVLFASEEAQKTAPKSEKQAKETPTLI